MHKELHEIRNAVKGNAVPDDLEGVHKKVTEDSLMTQISKDPRFDENAINVVGEIIKNRELEGIEITSKEVFIDAIKKVAKEFAGDKNTSLSPSFKIRFVLLI